MGKVYELPNIDNNKVTDEWVPLKLLHPYRTGDGLQRPVDEKWVEWLKTNFNLESMGVLHVVPGAGRSFGVFCGQHRTLAATAVLGGDYKVLVRVYRGYQPSEIARIAIALDRQKTWRPIYNWKRRFTAGEEVVVKIEAIIARHRLATGHTDSIGSIKAVHALETVYTRFGEDVLDRTLGILVKAWGKAPGAYEGTIISGLALALGKHGTEMDDTRIAEKLKKGTGKFSGSAGLIGHARSLANAIGKNVNVAMAIRILETYNSGLREPNQIPETV